MPGGSTLITSAPWSASIIVAKGPDTMAEASTTRTPASGPGMRSSSWMSGSLHARRRGPGAVAREKAAAGALALGARPAARPASDVGLLLVTIDTLRADALGAYGAGAARAPARRAGARARSSSARSASARAPRPRTPRSSPRASCAAIGHRNGATRLATPTLAGAFAGGLRDRGLRQQHAAAQAARLRPRLRRLRRRAAAATRQPQRVRAHRRGDGRGALAWLAQPHGSRSSCGCTSTIRTVPTRRRRSCSGAWTAAGEQPLPVVSSQLGLGGIPAYQALDGVRCRASTARATPARCATSTPGSARLLGGAGRERAQERCVSR